MKLRDKIDKIPRFCAGPHELQAGDLLIFNHVPSRAGPSVVSGNIVTVKPQGMMNEHGGHDEAEHVGYVVETDEGLKIAHVTSQGFLLENMTPDSSLPPDQDPYTKYMQRTINIFRPREKFQKTVAAELKEIVKEFKLANEAKLRQATVDASLVGVAKIKAGARSIEWRAEVAVRSFLHRLVGSLKILDQNPGDAVLPEGVKLPENTIRAQSICSVFAVDSYVTACNRAANRDRKDYARELMNISRLTIPKTLQAYLYRNTNYDFYVMPHSRDELYVKLKEVITRQIERLRADKRPAAKRKADDLEAELLASDKRHENVTDLMKKSISLLKDILPILKRNTGLNFRTPASFTSVMSFARNEGIYQNNFDFELHDRSEASIRKLAKKHYHFNDALATLYRDYTHRGYSDEEALFECKPSYGDWFKISPVRNILLTCTIIGFFAWVLPRGLKRTHDAEERNKKLIADTCSPFQAK